MRDSDLHDQFLKQVAIAATLGRFRERLIGLIEGLLYFRRSSLENQELVLVGFGGACAVTDICKGEGGL